MKSLTGSFFFFLAFLILSPQSSAADEQWATVTTLRKGLNIRTQPSTRNSRIVGSAAKGSRVRILPEPQRGNWYKIESIDSNGQRVQGWVSSGKYGQLLDLVRVDPATPSRSQPARSPRPLPPTLQARQTTQPRPSSNQEATVTTRSGRLSVRSGPGTRYGKLGGLSPGKTVQLTGRSRGNWLEVILEDGTKGWASRGARGQFLEVQTSNVDPATPSRSQPARSPSPLAPTLQARQTTQPRPSSSQEATVTTRSGRLSVRSGPGTRYGKVGGLSPGETVKLTGRSQGNWLEVISEDGTKGWASRGARGQFLKVQASNFEGETSSSASAQQQGDTSSATETTRWGLRNPRRRRSSAAPYPHDVSKVSKTRHFALYQYPTAGKGKCVPELTEDPKTVLQRNGMRYAGKPKPNELKALAKGLRQVERLLGKPIPKNWHTGFSYVTSPNSKGRYTWNSGITKRGWITVRRPRLSSKGNNVSRYMHELGHIVGQRGQYKKFAQVPGASSCKMTTYCGHSHNERFAEVFAAFVVYPELLKHRCPRVYNYFATQVFPQAEPSGALALCNKGPSSPGENKAGRTTNPNNPGETR